MNINVNGASVRRAYYLALVRWRRGAQRRVSRLNPGARPIIYCSGVTN